jgi:hypothetical protein
MIKYYEKPWGRIALHEGMLYLVYRKGLIFDINIAKNVLKERLDLAQGTPHFLFADCRGMKYWTKEARDFNLTPENLQLILGAVVVYTESYVANIVLNFYQKFNKAPHPVRFCSNKEEAIAWIHSIKRKKPLF